MKLPPSDATMLWLVYAARLCGHDGVAPVDLVDVCPRRWDDALGRTKLAATGAFRWRRSRVAERRTLSRVHLPRARAASSACR